MNLVIQIAGENQVARRLLRFTDRAIDMRPAFALIHEDFLETERLQFDTEGSYGGEPWAPLKDSTVSYKERNHLDPRILHATLHMRESLTEEDNEDHVFRATRSSLQIGTKDPKAKYHQSLLPRTRLPRRPVINLNEHTKREWVKIMHRWVFEAGY